MSATQETPRFAGFFLQADEGTRTPDLLITSELLYQLSYVGALLAAADPDTMGPSPGEDVV
jgi:hypothetical protein